MACKGAKPTGKGKKKPGTKKKSKPRSITRSTHIHDNPDWIVK